MKLCQALWTVCLPAIFGLDLDVGYYLHLVRGQFRLLWDRQSIERLLKQSDLDPQVRAQLRFVKDVCAFAEREIGLARSKNYTTFCNIGDGPVSWNLTASPKDRLEPVQWTYPVVGRFPYRGYFDRKRAGREQERLEQEGYDTYLRPVGAYSTLGWFKDPILSSMLRYRNADLADLIIHELTHATLWISGNVTFNESLATFVGKAGALLIMEARFGSGSAEVREVLGRGEDQRLFQAFMHEVAGELETLYLSDLSYEEKLVRREAVFEGARTRFAHLPLKTELYSNFHKWKLNNAWMMAYRTYHQEIDVFDWVYEAAGRDLKRTVEILKGCEGVADPGAYLEDWLARHRAGSADSLIR